MFIDKLHILIQHLLPHRWLSRCMFMLARVRLRWFKNLFIRTFIRIYRVDMTIAEQPDPGAYPHFNGFFTRALNSSARPIDRTPDHIICPVDGFVSQAGVASDDRLLQAKGVDYRLDALLGDDSDWSARFKNGSFATLYLSPRDYHRIHMPLDGVLQESLYIPGRLFSVNQRAVDHIPGLFTRNERLICLFDTRAGAMAMILVGAMFVSGIETVWSGAVKHARAPLRQDWRHRRIHLEKGREMGRFNMGSTVILLFGPGHADMLPGMTADTVTRMGEHLATLRTATAREL